MPDETQGRRSPTSTDTLWSLVQEMAGFGIWQWNISEDQVIWSDQLYRIFSQDKESFVPSLQGYLSLVHPDDRERIRQIIMLAYRDGQRVRFEERICLPDGSIRDLMSFALVIRDESGQPAQMIGACMDVTERRALQNALAQRERLAAMGTLVAGLTHELNNPLLYVNEALNSLHAEHVATTSETQALLQAARDGVKRMTGIVEDFRGLSGRETASLPINLAEVIHEAVALVENDLRHRAQLILDLDDTLHVQASSAQLGRLVLNLLSNAVQAIPPGHVQANRVRIALSQRGEQVELTVADTGSGMSAETRRRVFDPFYTTRPAGKGTGLGLYLVHQMVTRMEGSVQIVPLAQGTKVIVHLPRSPSPTAPKVSPAFPAQTQRRILIVDDDPLVRRALIRMLRDHDVIAAPTTAAAREHLSQDHDFDVVLCDVLMPEGLGTELYTHVQTHHPALAPRFRFITGSVDTDVDHLPPTGTPLTLEKPFARDDLLLFIEGVVAELGPIRDRS